MPDAIAELVTRDKISEVITKLFVCTDQLNWPDVLTCFSNRVLFDMSSMTGEDPVTMDAKDIVAAWDAGLSPLQAVHHQIGNLTVDVQNDAALAFCYGIASHYLPNPTNHNTRVFVGSYDFHLVRTSDSWKIDRFKFNLKYVDGNPNLERAAGLKT